ncbi:family 7 putative glycoside hydrolase [Triangularia verruculosa]|uniref:Glucanase n=1 Tax=Triangularia verruculosa TaxID=2587418 RepID=A0AAN6XRX1_9PEZI|nr:family 7 putative glycoside hydrolase [Triangularia verruculosa]
MTSLPALLLSLYVFTVAAQKKGHVQPENHPPFQWTKCTSPGNCTTINAEVVLDANWRWVHDEKQRTCVELGPDGTQWWDANVCDLGDEGVGTTNNCTSKCMLEGAGNYSAFYGITAVNNTLTQKLVTRFEFATTVGSRLFLLEGREKYQMFTLLGNELSFDVDLSTVGCGINAALYFVAMDADGGVERHKPYNHAGAEYGTGYCDGWCQDRQRFVAGKAATNKRDGSLREWRSDGACCPEFAVWDSNAHAFAMSSHICEHDDYNPCDGPYCKPGYIDPDDRAAPPQCARYGCQYNPYRMGVREFYGKGKVVDTTKRFTVVTRWEEDRQYQFFIQDGKRIDVPGPTLEGLPKKAGLTEEMCATQADVFSERYSWAEHGGWATHRRQVLDRPMVLVMSIDANDYFTWNAWLDSTLAPELPVGSERGPCSVENNDPLTVQASNSQAKVVWSNIRFGLIGSTTEL